VKSNSLSLATALGKAASGIIGFDEITGGGLPRGRTTLLVGGPGSGKTILALQFLVHGAQRVKIVGTLSQIRTVVQALGLEAAVR